MMEFLEILGIVMLIVAGIVGLLALIGMIAKKSLKKKEEEPEKPVPPPPPPTPPPAPYTHGQYDADLHNPQVSISDMLDQMEGETPEIPPEGGNQSPDPGIVVETPVPGEKKERGEERLDWFRKVAKEVPPVEIVPPPPMQGPVMTVKGQMIPCPHCTLGGRRVISTPVMGSGIGPDPFHNPKYRCGACKDKKYIFLQHG